ncbi:MAG: response regulator transcription factor [bacterium]
MSTRYRILLADDHAMFRAGVRKMILERPDLDVVAEVGDGLELLEALRNTKPDLVVLDISMPRLRGIEATREIKSLHPEVKVLVLTMHNKKEYCHMCLSAGADGYLLKEDTPSELFVAIDAIIRGATYISPTLSRDLMEDFVLMARGKLKSPVDPLSHREREVLRLIGEGKSSREIGKLLFISTRTVEHHRSSIMKKLRIKTTAELVRYALEMD